MLKMLMEQNT
jgi:hypothetical protein